MQCLVDNVTHINFPCSIKGYFCPVLFSPCLKFIQNGCISIHCLKFTQNGWISIHCLKFTQNSFISIHPWKKKKNSPPDDESEKVKIKLGEYIPVYTVYIYI